MKRTWGHIFNDRQLLVQALTHRSYASEDPLRQPHNERLEFLGDAAIKLTMTDILLRAFPIADEGFLTKARAYLVSDRHLGVLAQNLGVEQVLRLGKAILASPTVIATTDLVPNAMEAIVGAIYMDGGPTICDRFLRRLFAGPVQKLKDTGMQELQDTQEAVFQDYKSTLQERVIKQFKVWPEYSELEHAGPDHSRTFFMAVSVRGQELGRGHGRSKKEAGQAAARSALELLREQDAQAGLEGVEHEAESMLKRLGAGTLLGVDPKP